MNASVINRFAKIVTAGSAKGRSRRLALTLPLAAVIATGAVGCTPDTSTDAAPSAAPTLSAPAAATAPSTPAPSATTSVPAATPAATPTAETPAPAPAPSTTTPAPAAKAPAAAAKTPASVVKPGGGIEIRFDGLNPGQRIEAGGGTVAFSVTWTNTGTKRYDSVVPVVASQQYDGAACGFIGRMAGGTIERKEGNTWKQFPLSQGTGMDYVMGGRSATFPLPSGASRTIQYRIHLDADNGPGTLPVEAAAYDSVTTIKQIATKKVVDTKVVDTHMPKVTVSGGPGALVVGKQAAQYTVKVTNPTKAAFRQVTPTISLPNVVDPKSGDYTKHFIEAADLVVEVQDHGQWRPVTVDHDCNDNLAINADSLQRALPAGATTEYTFRIGVDKGWTTGNKFNLSFGATADQHRATAVKITPTVTG
ncbi:hypothetical protein GCM10010495_13770 [Kitasatospora herbaricolor]|uniref:hypothetical protein n=1 Tax=Kitasatospora herbaricolor TaxID=68217 RepID=UPI00174C1585|nr:hypothetical protein [Kitasatospora herbaricolor]MDQ0309186.1 hypothetical protein [Kitasatospora herbaricolor]GGV03539.1 hypothetical protein GCM10010495_13770 [Kitasatospora herbaricolor]